MGTSGSETPGSTGGSSTVVLQIRHMPRHRHKSDPHFHTQVSHDHTYSRPKGDQYFSGGNSNTWWGDNYNKKEKTDRGGGENTGSATPYTDYQGNGEAFNILPPFYKVHMWKRLT